MHLMFDVYGIPKPGGSKKAFPNPKTGRIVIVDDCKKNKDWRACVMAFALDEVNRSGSVKSPIQIPFEGPLSVVCIFWMPRPKSHYRTGRYADELKQNAPGEHIIRPDESKLWRSTEDALTDAGIWKDDSQVVEQHIFKMYSVQSGAMILIEPYRKSNLDSILEYAKLQEKEL